jgi:hypothetical protein
LEEKRKYSNASKKRVALLAQRIERNPLKKGWGFKRGHDSRTPIASAGEKEVCYRGHRVLPPEIMEELGMKNII